MTAATILCVDDEEHVLDSLRRVFLDDGYQLLLAVGGEQGLALVRANPVELVISDYRMPGMSGVELFEAVRDLYPDTVRILITAYSDLSDAIAAEVVRMHEFPVPDALVESFLDSFVEDIKKQSRDKQLPQGFDEQKYQLMTVRGPRIFLLFAQTK